MVRSTEDGGPRRPSVRTLTATARARRPRPSVRDDGIGLDPHGVPPPGLHVDLAAVRVDHQPLALLGRHGGVDLLDERERREGAGSQGEEHGRSFQLTEETSAAA